MSQNITELFLVEAIDDDGLIPREYLTGETNDRLLMAAYNFFKERE